jgi:hypothetical protein
MSVAALRTVPSTPLAVARKGERRRGPVTARCASHHGGCVTAKEKITPRRRGSHSSPSASRTKQPFSSLLVVARSAPEATHDLSATEDNDEVAGSTPDADTCGPPDSSSSSTPTPLLVFVNGKSGGQRGKQLTEELSRRKDLSPLEVVDLTRQG